VRPLLACLLLLAACAHAPTAPGPAPATDAAATPPAAVPPPVEDRFTPVRAAAEALLAAQGEAAWRGWTSGEMADPAVPWKGREALLDPALLVQLAEAVDAAPPPGRSRLERLRAFLLGEQLARAAAGPSQALAAARSAASFGWEKRTVPVRQLDTLLAGEPEAPRRKAAAEAWRAAVLKLEPLVAARDVALLRAAAERGFTSSLSLAGALRLEDAGQLAALAEATLASGDATWPGTLDALARQELGTTAARVREHDLPRLWRTSVAPEAFPADRQVADVAALLGGLGLDLSAGGRLTVDAEPRPGKLPRPLALPVEVPDQVRLSLTPLGGLDAARALLHEVGVALSLAHVQAGAAFEDRRLPPAWHTLAWGLLFEGIASDPAWLSAHGVPPEVAGREARVEAGRRVHAARAAAATVLAESARATDPDGAVARWATLGPRALGHPLDRGTPPPWRLAPDPQLRAADTLRAELLATRLSASLKALAGDQPWWRSPTAGDWLRRAWAEGGSWTLGPPAPSSTLPIPRG